MDGIDKHAVFREELGDCSVGDPFGIVTERPPIKQRPYRQPLTKRKVVEEEFVKF